MKKNRNRRNRSLMGAPSKSLGQGLRRSLRGMEMLEKRAMLAADSSAPGYTAFWQNPIDPLDVNNNGRVTSGDALIIVTELMTHGSHTLSAPTNLSLPQAAGSFTFFDVDGDNAVTKRDALAIVNQLVNPAQLAQIRLIATDLNGVPLTTHSVTPGTDFLLQARVQDIRNPNPNPDFAGVLSAYANVAIDNSIVSAATGAVFAFNPIYDFNQTGTIVTGVVPANNNIVVDAGAAALSQTLVGTGLNELVLWSVPIHADANGLVTFTPSLSTVADHDVLLFNLSPSRPLNANEVSLLPAVIGVGPTLSIDNITVIEGSSGTSNAVFTVTLTSADPLQDVTVNYGLVAGGTALAGTDYLSIPNGVLTFSAGGASTQTRTITVPVVGDTIVEADETFLLNLSNPSNAVLFNIQGTATIDDDDSLPTFSISNVTVTEGDALPTNAVFAVTLTGPNNLPVSVTYTTVNGTAVSGIGGDYTSTAGQLTFTASASAQVQFITVAVNGDIQSETAETFNVQLSTPTNASIPVGQDTGIGTIIDNDFPSLSVTGQSVTEGNVAFTPAVFTVNVVGQVTAPITVVYQTTDGSATAANSDYQATSGTLTFLVGGPTSQTVTVQVVGDTADEPSETFGITLSNAVGASVPASPGTISIFNDDGPPTLSVSDISVTEGNAGSTSAVFFVTLNGTVTQPVTVIYATNNSTATAGSDYTAITGTLSYAVGDSPTQAVTVTVSGDIVDEANETFSLNLSNGVNATVIDDRGLATIVNDDGAVNLARIQLVATDLQGNLLTGPLVLGDSFLLQAYVSDLRLPPFDINNGGVASAYFDINFNNTTVIATPNTINYGPLYPSLQQPLNTATAGRFDDLGAFTGIQNPQAPPLGAGQKLLFSIPISTTSLGFVDFTPGPSNNVDLLVTLFSSNTAVADADIDFLSTSVQVISDPNGPAISITANNNGNVNEGSPATYTVNLSAPSTHQVTVVYATMPGGANPATVGADYTAVVPTTLTFAPGVSSQTISVVTNIDTVFDPNETFQVQLTNPVNGALVSGQSLATTLIIDPPPVMLLSNVTVTEGNTGTTNSIFTLSLSGQVTQTQTIVFSTSDGTAIAGADYQARNGTLTFIPGGVTSRFITVPVLGDVLDEADETFNLNLTSLSSAVPATLTAVGTILDNDASPSLRINDVLVTEGNSGTATAGFVVTLSAVAGQSVTVEFDTTDLTATVAGNDYLATSGTLTFAPGVTTQTINVLVNGDTIGELNETFRVNLRNPVNATFSDSQGIGTIVNEDGQPDQARIALSLADSQGNALTGPINIGDTFQLLVSVTDLRTTPSNPSQRGVASAYLDINFTNPTFIVTPSTINYGTDFPLLQQPLNVSTAGLFNDLGAFVSINPATPTGPREPLLLLSIPIQAANPGSITFTGGPTGNLDLLVTLFNQNTAVADTDIDFGTPVTVQVLADPSTPTANITTAVSGGEGTSLAFSVDLSIPKATTVTVVYATANGTATAGSDYTPQSGTLTFLPGETSKTVFVPATFDGVPESSETFFVNLTSANGAVLGTTLGTGTIINDNTPPPPTASIALAASGAEGSSLSFNVNLSAVVSSTVTVTYATANGVGVNGATAGNDYAAQAGTLTFLPGQTSQTIAVPALLDNVIESSETFFVNLTGSTGIALGTTQGTGTIVDVPPPPAAISGFVYTDTNNNGQYEPALGEFGIAGATVTITNNVNFTQTIFTIADGSYSLTLPGGTYSVIETQPGFYIDGKDTPGVGQQPQTTPNDRFDNVTIATGSPAAGYNFGEVGVRPEFVSIFFNRQTFLASAILSDDGTPVGLNNLDLRQGEVWISFDGGWQGTRLLEATFLSILGSVSLTLYDNNLTELVTSTTQPNIATILHTGTPGQTVFLKISGMNPDVDLTFKETASIGNITLTEGNTGTANAVFTVALSTASTQAITVGYTTVDGTATAGNDYVAKSGTVTFAAGVTSQTVTVAVIGDVLDEANETFQVQLTSLSAPAGSYGLGTVLGNATIVDNDPVPSLSINNQNLLEGDSGTTGAVFTVSLSAASGRPVTVKYATSNGSAAAPSDYTAQSGTLTFAPGVTTQSIAVPIIGDGVHEGNETFAVNLSAATNANLAVPLGLGSIVDEPTDLLTSNFVMASQDPPAAPLSASVTSSSASNSAAATPATATWEDPDALLADLPEQALWDFSDESDASVDADSIDSVFAQDNVWLTSGL